MILQPKTALELASEFKRLALSGTKVSGVDLGNFNQVIEYACEDMTITAQTGMLLSDLQNLVARNGQWLPIDPPLNGITLHDLISRNLSGPKRLGYGIIRDYLLGLQAVTGDGEVIRSGGRVVKNVAGYDLAKLFVGSGITLGVVTEAAFMLRPLPEETRILSTTIQTLEAGASLVETTLKSQVLPVALDLTNLRDCLELRVCLEGFHEDVEAQNALLQLFAPFAESSMDAESAFFSASPAIHHLSVLPSQVVETLKTLKDRRFVARAGNGIIYYDGNAFPKPIPSPTVKMLSDRLKKTFDPHFILPHLPA